MSFSNQYFRPTKEGIIHNFILYFPRNNYIPTSSIPCILPKANLIYIQSIQLIREMFLGDPLSLETHLNNDWSLLLRNLKTRQDYLLELLQYNFKIITQVREQNSQVFVNDEIFQHQNQRNKINNAIQVIEREEKEIYEKYQGTFLQEERAIKLMSRVGARILEIYHNSIDKCKAYDDTLNEKYLKTKKTLIQLLNQTDGIHIEEIIKLVVKYSNDKLVDQIEKLNRLIIALENGQYSKLKEVYVQKEKIVVKSVERKIDVLRDLSKAKAQKEAAKTQQKNQQKLKKQKQKMMNNLYSTMELSKQQFLDDQTILPDVKMEKLYNQILSRNRYNSEQILQFNSKKQLFQQRIKTFQEFIQKQSKKVPQVFIRRPLRRQKPPQQAKQSDKHSISIQNRHNSITHESESNIQNIMTEGNLDIAKIQRKANTEQFKIKSLSTKKDMADLPNIFNSFLATNENFSSYKFDRANRQIYTRVGRNIFPDIGKGTSLDPKTQITKIKIDKILRTTIKNDEKTHDGTHRKHESSRKTAVIHREEAKMIEESHRIRTNIRNIDLSVQGAFKRVLGEKQKLKAESLSEEHGLQGLHVKKAELKYFQPKLNLIF